MLKDTINKQMDAEVRDAILAFKDAAEKLAQLAEPRCNYLAMEDKDQYVSFVMLVSYVDTGGEKRTHQFGRMTPSDVSVSIEQMADLCSRNVIRMEQQIHQQQEMLQLANKAMDILTEGHGGSSK
jgi:hypothetical protein